MLPYREQRTVHDFFHHLLKPRQCQKPVLDCSRWTGQVCYTRGTFVSPSEVHGEDRVCHLPERRLNEGGLRKEQDLDYLL